MRVKGKVFKFSDNIDTDVIIPARYLVYQDPKILAKLAFESIRKDFYKETKEGGIIVAGKNFGSGSSREHAVLAIKGLGIKCVIAKTFSRIFFRNCINLGLVAVTLKETDLIKENDVLEVDVKKGLVKNITQNTGYKFSAYPDFLMQIVKKGGLLKWLTTK